MVERRVEGTCTLYDIRDIPTVTYNFFGFFYVAKCEKEIIIIAANLGVCKTTTGNIAEIETGTEILDLTNPGLHIWVKQNPLFSVILN